ncbi:MAG: peptidylprolyl isomerase [bacterium]|jgi:parvulin-like peptidyl-prolyl isomerase|nr:peptidylprolyl isomerase [candidate division KSB1 bacterium]MDH7560720.1 peptidylprolyl isomerase [bacterium]
MKRIGVSILLVALTFAACTRPRTEKLQPNTAAYALASDLSKSLPFLDPNKNRTLVKTRHFRVTVGDVMEYLVNKMGDSAGSLRTMQLERVKETVTRTAESLAEQRLLLRAAQREGISVSASQVDSVLQSQYERFGGAEQYALLLQRSGVSLDFLRNDTRNSLLVTRYLDRVLAPVATPSEEEIRQAYEEERYATIRHILFLTQGHVEEEKPEIRAKAEAVLARARAGEDMAELARLYSEDEETKDKGGLVVDVPRGEMLDPLDQAAFSHRIGEVSDLIEVPYGYHILQVVERKKDPRPLEDMRPFLVSECKAKKRVPAYQQLMTKLRQEARWWAAKV